MYIISMSTIDNLYSVTHQSFIDDIQMYVCASLENIPLYEKVKIGKTT